jgi:hypothetical protein
LTRDSYSSSPMLIAMPQSGPVSRAPFTANVAASGKGYRDGAMKEHAAARLNGG